MQPKNAQGTNMWCIYAVESWMNNVALWRYKNFGLKIRWCKLLDKYHIMSATSNLFLKKERLQISWFSDEDVCQSTAKPRVMMLVSVVSPVKADHPQSARDTTSLSFATIPPNKHNQTQTTTKIDTDNWRCLSVVKEDTTSLSFATIPKNKNT